MEHAFFAMMHRMRYINRWSLMRNTQSENIQEHSLQVAMIAHALAVIRRRFYAGGRVAVEPSEVALMALYHDAGEILTGDLPTPVKYATPELREAYRELEEIAAHRLLNQLPAELRDDYAPLLIPSKTDHPDDEAWALVKAADKIAALIKCVDEEKTGNREFRQAAQQTMETVRGLAGALPEVAYFVERLLPAFSMTLDELNTQSSSWRNPNDANSP